MNLEKNWTTKEILMIGKSILLIQLVGFLLMTSACSSDSSGQLALKTLPGLPETTSPDLPFLPSLPADSGIPAAPMVFNYSWTNPDHPNFISFSLSSQSQTNQYYKRVDIYEDTMCSKLIDIVTPADLEDNLILWPAEPGVVNHIAVVETDINNVRRPCKVVASSSVDSDIIPPTTPSNLKVTYNWRTETQLEVNASWSASVDADSNINYTIYLIPDANGYAEPIASFSTTELSRKFIIKTGSLDRSAINKLYFHIVASDSSDNISPAVTDSGIYLGTEAAALDVKIAYIALGSSALNLIYREHV